MKELTDEERAAFVPPKLVKRTFVYTEEAGEMLRQLASWECHSQPRMLEFLIRDRYAKVVQERKQMGLQ